MWVPSTTVSINRAKCLEHRCTSSLTLQMLAWFQLNRCLRFYSPLRQCWKNSGFPTHAESMQHSVQRKVWWGYSRRFLLTLLYSYALYFQAGQKLKDYSTVSLFLISTKGISTKYSTLVFSSLVHTLTSHTIVFVSTQLLSQPVTESVDLLGRLPPASHRGCYYVCERIGKIKRNRTIRKCSKQ